MARHQESLVNLSPVLFNNNQFIIQKLLISKIDNDILIMVVKCKLWTLVHYKTFAQEFISIKSNIAYFHNQDDEIT
jgi:hypothetical protein